MFDGSLATRGPWEALVTFQQLLVLSDRFGHVDMTPAVIARRTTIPEAIIEKGLQVLAEPDPESRRDAEQGRRIVLLDPGRPWGWRIVNYTHYRQIRSAEERRDYQREYMRAKRAKDKPRRKANGKHPISDDWLPSERTIQRLGEEFKLSQAELQKYFDHFVSSCKAKDYRYKDFDAAFSNSVRADWPRLREGQIAGDGYIPPEQRKAVI